VCIAISNGKFKHSNDGTEYDCSGPDDRKTLSEGLIEFQANFLIAIFFLACYIPTACFNESYQDIIIPQGYNA
jgi:hypothetical protein